MASFTSPFGTFDLKRFPAEHHPSLRAWDAADEYLLQHVMDHREVLAAKPRVLLVEDGFGALSLALHTYQPTIVSDSFLAHEAIRSNAAAHQLPDTVFTLCSPLEPLMGLYDLVLIKTPKAHAYLEDLLVRIKPHLHAETVVIGGGMARHIHMATLEAFERVIGPTTTSLARKKARLILATVDLEKTPEFAEPTTYRLEQTPYSIFNYTNVFSRNKLDKGTRFLLRHLPQRPKAQSIIDLGCGSGVIGLIAAAQHPEADVHFVDASFMAIASAQTTLLHNIGDVGSGRFHFTVGDGLVGFPKASADLVLCNPPFHQQHASGHHLAFRLFEQATHTLRTGGALWMVANQHLGYRAHLQRHFKHVWQAAKSSKFVIWEAIKE